MQKQWDTPTHVRGTRLQPSTVSGASTRLQPESTDCTILHTILHVKGKVTTSEVQQPQDCAVSRLGANEQSEHIQPVWIAQSQSSKKHQVDVEIDTGTGCNVMPLYKVQELFGQE